MRNIFAMDVGESIQQLIDVGLPIFIFTLTVYSGMTLLFLTFLSIKL